MIRSLFIPFGRCYRHFSEQGRKPIVPLSLMAAMRKAPSSDVFNHYSEIKKNPMFSPSRSQYNQFLYKLAVKFPIQAQCIVDDMTIAGVTLDESSYLAIIRSKVSNGDSLGAFRIIEDMEIAGMDLKLRHFLPLLHSAFSESSFNIEMALHIWQQMQRLQVQPLEAECIDLIAALLRNCVAHHELIPATWLVIDEIISEHLASKTMSISTKAADKLTLLYDKYKSALADFPPNEIMGTIERVDLSKYGSCPSCGSELKVRGPTPAETEQLRNSLFQTAQKLSKSSSIELGSFSCWLKNRLLHNEYTVVIDAANVAYFGQNCGQGLFSFHQIETVVQALKDEGEKPLIIIPHRYMRKNVPNSIGYRIGRVSSQVSVKEAALREKWRAHNIIYETRGFDDDWFWMYATIAKNFIGKANVSFDSGDDEKVICVVTNDATRNHRPENLDMRAFQRWRASRVRGFKLQALSQDGSIIRPLEEYPFVSIQPTAPFSREMQRIMSADLSHAYWHVPIDSLPSDEETPSNNWLCIGVPLTEGRNDKSAVMGLYNLLDKH